MVIAVIGESCTGKTSIANELATMMPIEIFAGKDYLRMAKNPNAAAELFQKYLAQKQNESDVIVFLITEKDDLKFLPDNAILVHCTAPIAVIKERFAQRMHGNMPPQVTMMLERKHGMFDDVPTAFTYDTTQTDIHIICEEIRKTIYDNNN